MNAHLTRPGIILVCGKEYTQFSLLVVFLLFLSSCFNYRFLWLHNYSRSVAFGHCVWPFWTYNCLSALDKPIDISTMLVGLRGSQREEVLFWVHILGESNFKMRGTFCENLLHILVSLYLSFLFHNLAVKDIVNQNETNSKRKVLASKTTAITNSLTTGAGRMAGTSKSRRWKGVSVQN